MSNKKGFFLRLDQYERNVLQLESEATGLSMSAILKKHLRDDKLTSVYTLTIQNVKTGETISKDQSLDRYTSEIMREGIGTLIQNKGHEYIFKSIVLKIEKDIEPSNVIMNKVLSKMYKGNPLN